MKTAICIFIFLKEAFFCNTYCFIKLESHVLSRLYSNLCMWFEHLYLICRRSFVWATVGTTFVSFVSGGLAFWAPKFIAESQKKLNKNVKQDKLVFIDFSLGFDIG